jgi:endonuclease YncB( thermonuclease family)
MKKLMLLGLCLLIAASGFGKEVISGKVVSVIDGNTIEVLTADNETYKLMLHGIDCPELEQDYGDAAKKHLEKILSDKQINAEVQGKNRYGVRQVVIVMDDVDLRHELLKKGLAWTSEVNPLPDLESLKEEAREKGKGLWKENDPTPPWVFRRQQTRGQMKSS